MQWIYLAIAILSEVCATSALKAAGLSKPIPLAIVLVGYASAFYFLSLTLSSIPVGVAYAIWAGAGVALITLFGWVLYGQKLDAPSVIGIALILIGVLVIRIFGGTTAV